MDTVRALDHFEALSKIALLLERIIGLRAAYRGTDLLLLVDQVVRHIDLLESEIAARRDGGRADAA